VEYANASEDIQSFLAERNTCYEFELKFLNKLLQSLDESQSGLLLFTIPYEELRKKVESSLIVAGGMKYEIWNTAGLVLSDSKLYLEKRNNS